MTNRLVAADTLLEEAQTWAKALAKRPTLAIGIAKADMFYAMDNSLKDTIEFEAKEQIAAFKSHDLKEGVSAFIEKRKANFIGE